MADGIEVRGVSLEYGSSAAPVLAVKDASFSVAPSEFLCIVGPSGCGKTTILNMLAGFLAPTRGDILIGGKRVGVGDAKTNRGVVFQDFAQLFPWRTARANVEFGLEMRGVGKAERRDTAMEYLRLVALEKFAGSYPHQLSGGMQQRVAIARALTLDPEILLMDEPFGALDALTRDRMAFELLDICQRSQKTVMFVTHSVSEAVLLSDAVVVLTPRPGQVQAIRAIDLPRPRTKETRMTPEFTAYTHQLLRDLEGQRTEDGS
jgi:NitT/TauT family transport system ATP-binding protein